jgi:transposase-like protein
MINAVSRYRRHRFPIEIISHSVWLYHRFCLSFRDVEDLLADRGVEVSYETIRRRWAEFDPDCPDGDVIDILVQRRRRSLTAWQEATAS